MTSEDQTRPTPDQRSSNPFLHPLKGLGREAVTLAIALAVLITAAGIALAILLYR
jgi:hypothetical protein